MYIPLQCITLRTVRYDDRRAIVSVWSPTHGYVALMVPDGQSREARRRRAIMMPLGIFEGESDIRPGKKIHSIRDVRPLVVMPSLAVDPAKATVAMFICEVLDRILRDTAPDAALGHFIFKAVEWLDRSDSPRGVANFPVVFLYHLGALLGIAPDCAAWRPGCVFDMEGGVFRASAPVTGRWLDAENARGVHTLARISFPVSARVGIPRDTRRRMLELLLEYYSIHYTGLSDVKSPAVLREIF